LVVAVAVFPEKVQPTRVRVPLPRYMPPPLLALLDETVQLVSVNVLDESM